MSDRPAEAPPASPGDPAARLLARYLAGEQAAFEALVRQFKAPIYSFFLRSGVRSATADELFQETFLRVHAHGRSFRADRPLKVWLFTIASNLLKSHFRRQKVRRIMVGWWSARDGLPLDPVATGPAADELLDARRTLRWLSDALEALPVKPRQALILTRLEGLKLHEAAAVMGVSVNTIKTWVRRGRLTLEDALARHQASAQEGSNDA